MGSCPDSSIQKHHILLIDFYSHVSEQTGMVARSLYGLWMVLIVVAWDILVCITIGNQHVKNRLGKAIYYVEKLAGCMLVGFAVYVVLT